MLTFCDNKEPLIIKALSTPESPFYSVKPQIKEPWFLKFNNSAIYQKQSEDDNFIEMFWKVCMGSFKIFYSKKIDMLSPKSLALSKEVLQERENL
jgi:hypothetical protein